MCKHKWIVYSTGLINRCLMLYCNHCDVVGTVNNPTRGEWSQAFYAPRNQYTWKGGNDRVTIRHPKKCA